MALRVDSGTGGAAAGFGHSLGALLLNSLTSFVAGWFLVRMAGFSLTFPGLMLIVLPTIGLAGNIFTSFGSRLSTAVHTQGLSWTRRPTSVIGQNLLASAHLTLFMSFVLAGMARVVIGVLGFPTAVGFLNLLVVSTVGALLGALPLAAFTVGLSRLAVRWKWDLDNLVAPLVSTLGDVIVIPAIWLAAEMVGRRRLPPLVGAVCLGVLVLVTVAFLRGPFQITRAVVRDSIPVLAGALLLDTLGGVVLDRQLQLLAVLHAIYALQPAFVSSAGALGGILCARMSTELHLGLLEPTLTPGRVARRKIGALGLLALPTFAFNAVGAVVVCRWAVSQAPGWSRTLLVSLSLAPSPSSSSSGAATTERFSGGD